MRCPQPSRRACVSPGRSRPSLSPRPGSSAIGRRIITILALFRPLCSASGSPESTAMRPIPESFRLRFGAELRSGNGHSAFAPAIAHCGVCSRASAGKKESFFASCRCPASDPSGGSLLRLRSADASLRSARSLPHGAPASLVLAPAGARAGLASSEALTAFPVRRIARRGAPLPLQRARTHPVRRLGPVHFGSSAFPPGLPAIARPSPRLWAHSLAQTRTSSSVLGCTQKPSLRRVGLAVCVPIAARQKIGIIMLYIRIMPASK